MHKAADRLRQALAAARRTAAVLALIAFALRSLIPDGYMPDVSAHHGKRAGLVSIVLCSGTGPVTVLMPQSALPGAPQKQSPSKPAHHHAPCPFAGAFAQGLMTAFVVPAPFVQAAPASDDRPAAAAAGGRFVPYLAQGPPAAG
ncbi:MAG: DUF2946 domain-containing protein [Alphaproteobacteria bacterium]|nr:DUF2946 domain-containing protein [Alphaproteobacteria bacterium]